MSSIVQIDSLVSSNATSAVAVVSGVPNGSLTFYCSRVPDGVKTLCASSGSGPYTITLPHEDLWYVWAHDNDGYSVNAAAVWSSSGSVSIANEVGRKLRDILKLNQVGIEARIASLSNGATIKQIVYGNPGEIPSFPFICIMEPRFSARYVAAPYVREVELTFTIINAIHHSDEQSQLEYAVDFNAAVEHILSSPFYETIVLPSGRIVNFGQCTSGKSDDIDLGDDGFASLGSLVYSVKYLQQDTAF